MQKKLFILITILWATALLTAGAEAQERLDCGPGICLAGSFCDDCQCYDPDTDISRAFCQCDLLDPACGIGECVGAAYCDGLHCPGSGVCWAVDTPQSQVMCGGAGLDEACQVIF